jgi:hypothetical protein
VLDVVGPGHHAALVDHLIGRPGQDGLEVDNVLVDVDSARLRVAQAGRVGPRANVFSGLPPIAFRVGCRGNQRAHGLSGEV